MKPFIIVAAVAVFVALRLTFRYRRHRAKAVPPTPPQPELATSPQPELATSPQSPVRIGSATSSKPPRRSLLVSLFGDVGLVAQREVRERIRGRVFQVGTGIILLVVVAAIVVPVLTRSKTEPERVGVVGTLSSPLRTAVAASADAIGTTMAFVSESDESAADADLRSGHVDLVILDGTQVVVNKTITAGDTSTTAQLAGAVAQTLGTAAAFQAAGLSAAQADAISNARPVAVLGLQPASTGHPRKHSPASVFTLVLVFVMLSQYSTWILTGVVEEKTSRVVEVLLAAVRPAQLLGGKVLGIGLVAAAQATVLVAVALGLSEAVGSDLLHGTGPITVLVALVWLVLGYAFYCWVYAAAGSTVERQEQVQSLAFPLTIPVIVGYIVSLTAATSGRPTTFVEVLAYLPPTAPFAMPTLVSLGTATWWEFAISVGLSIVSTVAIARLATSIYRRAILRTGRRVRIRELVSAKPTANR
jgi:ABC-2 type transport system permease protein